LPPSATAPDSARSAPSWPGLRDYEGTYALTPDTDLRIFRRDGRLFAESRHQAATELTRSGPESFAAEAVGALFSFERDDDGKVVALTMEQAGKLFRAKKR
jgi:hypothetical protein